MPSCYIHIQYGDIMPLDNTTIGKLNEMTTMINDKSKLDESNIKYVKSLFAELVHGSVIAKIRTRITNISHYAQSRHQQSDNLHIIEDDSCGCGGSC